MVEFKPLGSDDVISLASKATGLDMKAEAAAQVVAHTDGDIRLIEQVLMIAEKIAAANKSKEITTEIVRSAASRRFNREAA